MARAVLASLVVLVVLPWTSATAGKAPGGRLAPLVVGTDDPGLSGKPKTPPAAKPPAKPPAPIQVDEKTQTVRIPVTRTGARGVVERLLSSAGKHPTASALVTAHSAKAIAEAFAKAGLKGGTRPVQVGSDRARPPAGTTLEVHLVVTRPGGKTSRAPAAGLLAAKSDGTAVGDGTWVYVGPAVLRDGDLEILITELSGSVATTNLRDATAMIYWVPKTDDAAPYVRAYYAATVVRPVEGERLEFEIRPAPQAGAPGGADR